MMKIRYLGHSCVEIVGRHHILIDPDFTRDPLPEVDYICISHAHTDHIGRVAEVSGGMILASDDVCGIAAARGVPTERLHPVKAGQRVANIQVLPGYSSTNNLIYTIFILLIKRRMPQPAGTPLSFLVEDETSLLHIGDAEKFPSGITPGVLCLPWRTSPYNADGYKTMLLNLVSSLNPRYILPIHYDLPGTDADPAELAESVNARVLLGNDWFEFRNNSLVTNSTD